MTINKPLEVKTDEVMFSVNIMYLKESKINNSNSRVFNLIKILLLVI